MDVRNNIFQSKNPVLFGWTTKIGAVAKFLDNLLLEHWI